MTRMIRKYNRFAQKEMAMEDFQKVREYATNDYFEKQTKADQAAITSAYARIEQGTAGKYDMLIVMEYWKDCKREYQARKRG